MATPAIQLGHDENATDETQEKEQPQAMPEQLPPLNIQSVLARIEKFCASNDPRNYINGIYFETAIEDNGRLHAIRMTATNGHYLGTYEHKVGNMNCPSRNMRGLPLIVPIAVAKEMLQAIKKGKGSVYFLGINEESIQMNDRNILFDKIDGIYPDYMRIMPESPKFRYKLNRLQLINAIEQQMAHIKSNGGNIRSEEYSLRINMEDYIKKGKDKHRESCRRRRGRDKVLSG